jgi:hypothetical protein
MAKTPAEIRSLARAHTATAVSTLAGIMRNPKISPAARVAAACAILDRGWGKPTQPMSGDDCAPPIAFRWLDKWDDDDGGNGLSVLPYPAK